MVRVLNPTAAALLGLLAEGERSGYDLNQVAQQRLGDYWTITRSQVYRELATLAELGLIVAGESGPRSRRPYRLTPQGRDAFADWILRSPGLEVIRFPLLVTINFGSWVGRDRLLAFMAEQKPAHEERLAGYLKARDAALERGDSYVNATVGFGIRYEQAVLAWMEELPGLLAAAPDAAGRDG